jgi:hypothetical protein
MKLSLISSLAFATAILVSPVVVAQDAAAPTMIGQQALSADDLPAVQAQCNTLAGVANQGLSSDTNSSNSTNDGAGDSGTDSQTPDGTAAATSKVDLAVITIEDCKAAGLAK